MKGSTSGSAGRVLDAAQPRAAMSTAVDRGRMGTGLHPPPSRRHAMLAPMSTETVATQRGKKIKELEVMVADVIQETPDTTTLLLFTGNDRMDYQAGHFLTIDPH